MFQINSNDLYQPATVALCLLLFERHLCFKKKKPIETRPLSPLCAGFSEQGSILQCDQILIAEILKQNIWARSWASGIQYLGQFAQKQRISFFVQGN